MIDNINDLMKAIGNIVIVPLTAIVIIIIGLSL